MNQPTRGDERNPYAHAGNQPADAASELLPHSGYGIASTCCGLLAYLLLAATIAMAVVVESAPVHPPHDDHVERADLSGIFLVSMLGICSCGALNIVGTFCGLLGLNKTPPRRKTYVYTGFALNLPLFLLGLLGHLSVVSG